MIRRTLLTLEILTAFGAIGAGALMVLDPTGPVTMGDEVLAQLGYHSWRTVGLFLITLIGLLPAVVVAAELRHHRLAALGHLVVGGTLVTWIVVQVLRIGVESPLQPAFFIVGWLVVGLAWTGYRREIARAFRA